MALLEATGTRRQGCQFPASLNFAHVVHLPFCYTFSYIKCLMSRNTLQHHHESSKDSSLCLPLQIGANAGVIGMTKEHLGLALALNVPVFVVITKIDMCPPNVLQETLKLLNKILKSPGCRKIPVLVQTMDDVVVTATNFTSERYMLFPCHN